MAIEDGARTSHLRGSLENVPNIRSSCLLRSLRALLGNRLKPEQQQQQKLWKIERSEAWKWQQMRSREEHTRTPNENAV